MSKTVLVVDDSATARQQVRMVLSQAGYAVVEAFDGLDGAQKIEASTDIDCVICDVNMPRLNGLEMLHRVKSQPQHANLPIVMLTTEAQPSLIATAREAGAKGWIVKPFKPEILVAAVKKLAPQ
jgi:two-component system chemotaxis response regulator CheY